MRIIWKSPTKSEIKYLEMLVDIYKKYHKQLIESDERLKKRVELMRSKQPQQGDKTLQQQAEENKAIIAKLADEVKIFTEGKEAQVNKLLGSCDVLNLKVEFRKDSDSVKIFSGQNVVVNDKRAGEA